MQSLKDKYSSRRNFLIQLLGGTTGSIIVGSLVTSCGSDSGNKTAAADDCEDFSAVSEADLKKRKNLGYVKHSPIADMTCDKCNLYLAPKPGRSCGSCMLFKGPVPGAAYCTYWAAKQTQE